MRPVFRSHKPRRGVGRRKIRVRLPPPEIKKETLLIECLFFLSLFKIAGLSEQFIYVAGINPVSCSKTRMLLLGLAPASNNKRMHVCL